MDSKYVFPVDFALALRMPKYIRNIYLRYKTYTPKSLWKIISGSTAVNTHLNYFRSNLNKKTVNNALTDEKVWADLITNPDTQELLNEWLSDSKKHSNHMSTIFIHSLMHSSIISSPDVTEAPQKAI